MVRKQTRQPFVAEVQKVLTRQGVLRIVSLRVSHQVIIKRLDALPVVVTGQLFPEVCTRVQTQLPPSPQSVPPTIHDTLARTLLCCTGDGI